MPSVDCGAIGSGAHQLPGVGPSRPYTMTFSTQRYEPRRPPLAIRAGDRTTRLILQDVDEPLRTEMLPVLSSALAFPSPDAVFLSKLARSNGKGTAVEREGWTQKLHRLYENLSKRARPMMKNSIVRLVAVWVPLRRGARYMWNSAIHVVALFKRTVRGFGQLVGPGRVPMIRIQVT